MSNYKSPVQRHPDHCPRHPDDHRIRTEYEPAGWGDARLIQHWCGHDGCDQPLGWQFEQKGKPNEFGPGQCQDPKIPYLLRTAEHDGWTKIAIIGLLSLTILAGIIIAQGWQDMEAIGRTFAVAGGVATMLTIPLTMWIRAKTAPSPDATATNENPT